MELLRNLARRKLRVGLTLFGIVIGVFALVVMGAMAEKMNLLLDGANKFLVNRIAITEKGSGGPFTMGGQMLPVEMAERVAQVPGVANVETAVDLLFKEEAGFSFGPPDYIEGIDLREWKRTLEVNPDSINLDFAAGDWWKEGERGVAVLGADLAKELGAEVGSTVEARGHEFRVVGILERVMTGPDKGMFVPIEDARAMLADSHPLLQQIDTSKLVGTIYAIPAKDKDPEEVAREIQRRIPEVKVYSPNEVKKQIAGFSVVFNAMMLGSAVIALVVGGLSVMNTMVMSISERVREIGIKKAIGASSRDILREFLSESAILSFSGGILGGVLGYLFTFLLNTSTRDTGVIAFTVTPRLALFVFLLSLFIGAGAGLLPARRAARIDPVRALRTLG